MAKSQLYNMSFTMKSETLLSTVWLFIFPSFCLLFCLLQKSLIESLIFRVKKSSLSKETVESIVKVSKLYKHNCDIWKKSLKTDCKNGSFADLDNFSYTCIVNTCSKANFKQIWSLAFSFHNWDGSKFEYHTWNSL